VRSECRDLDRGSCGARSLENKKIAVGGGRAGGGEKRGWDGSVCQKKRFGEEHE
jgi:hypothetical protein